jgi:hypothetical protein
MGKKNPVSRRRASPNDGVKASVEAKLAELPRTP